MLYSVRDRGEKKEGYTYIHLMATVSLRFPSLHRFAPLRLEGMCVGGSDDSFGKQNSCFASRTVVSYLYIAYHLLGITNSIRKYFDFCSC